MRLLFPVILSGLLGGCATQPPRWVGEMRQEKGKMYLSGISTNCPNVSYAYQGAYQQALATIAQYLNSQVSVHSKSKSDNYGSYLETEIELVSKQISVNKVQVEKFISVKENNKWTGYMLISVTEKDLKETYKELEHRQKEAAKKREKVLTVTGKNTVTDNVIQQLRQFGFQTGKEGEKVYLSQNLYQCKFNDLYKLYTVNLGIQADFGNKKSSFEEKGFGNTCAKARSEALNDISLEIVKWLEEIL